MRKLLLLLAILSSSMIYAASTPASVAPSASFLSSPEPALILPRAKHPKKLNVVQRWAVRQLQKNLKKFNVAEEGVPTEHQRRQGKLSMIFGIVSLVSLFTPVGIIAIPLSIAGLILGLKSIKGNSNGPGITGVVTSSVTLLLFIVVIILVAAFLSGWN